MKNLNELIKEIKESNKTNNISIDSLCDYDGTSDLQYTINEIADNYINIYTYDLLEWVKYNYSYIEKAINEFDTPTDEKGNADFIKMIQQGQYMANLESISNNINDMIKLYILDVLQKNDIEKLSENDLNIINKLIEYYINNNYLDDKKELLEIFKTERSK